MNNRHDAKQTDTIVIGGGQAGLAVGYHLQKQGVSFQILDAHARIGDAWRYRWDSLRLFTPGRYVGLPGMRFPGRGDAYPTKDEVAGYLADYAARFRLPVRSNVRVDRLWKQDGRFVMTAGAERFEANNVVVAMANYQVPRVPVFAQQLDRRIVQLHSHQYRNPSQLQPGPVLVVGVGNSGADIAIETARTHATLISGKESGHVPLRIETPVFRYFAVRLVRFVFHHVLSVRTPMGRRARLKMLANAAPLVRVKPADLIQAGIERVPRVVGIENGLPLLSDGRTVNVSNVIWCTGYQHGFPWIDLAIFGENGDPIHDSGVVERSPGLFFVGLHFLYAMSSGTLMGVGRDAERIAQAVASRKQDGRAQLTVAAASSRVA